MVYMLIITDFLVFFSDFCFYFDFCCWFLCFIWLNIFVSCCVKLFVGVFLKLFIY